MVGEEEEVEAEELETEFKFTLTTPVPYSFEGEQVKAKWIHLLPPNSHHMKPCCVLQQAFMRAATEGVSDDVQAVADAAAAQATDPAESTKPSGGGVMAAMGLLVWRRASR